MAQYNCLHSLQPHYTTLNAVDRGKTLQRLQEIEAMGNDRKAVLFDLIDTYIRDFKTRQTYA